MIRIAAVTRGMRSSAYSAALVIAPPLITSTVPRRDRAVYLVATEVRVYLPAQPCPPPRIGGDRAVLYPGFGPGRDLCWAGLLLGCFGWRVPGGGC